MTIAIDPNTLTELATKQIELDWAKEVCGQAKAELEAALAKVAQTQRQRPEIEEESHQRLLRIIRFSQSVEWLTVSQEMARFESGLANANQAWHGQRRTESRLKQATDEVNRLRNDILCCVNRICQQTHGDCRRAELALISVEGDLRSADWELERAENAAVELLKRVWKTGQAPDEKTQEEIDRAQAAVHQASEEVERTWLAVPATRENARRASKEHRDARDRVTAAIEQRVRELSGQAELVTA